MGLIQVGFSGNLLQQHPLTTKDTLDEQTASLSKLLQTIPFTDFLKNGGERNDNRHRETFIVKIDGVISEMTLEQVQQITSNDNFKLLSVSLIGNKYQQVKAVIQGHKPDDPKSGFERPIVSEGPHMILCLYSYDSEGKLRIFRTLQLRNGRVYVDTIRGFADSTSLEDGTVLYDLEKAEDRIYSNITKAIKDEGGQKLLNIKKITYLGAPVVNSSFVSSQSATFAVEVNYELFRKFSQVITANELQRRQEGFAHEGLTEYIIDMSVSEYLGYKLDPTIIRDNAADGPSDIVLQYHLTKILLQAV